MTAVSQWEREAIGELTRDAMSHKRNQGERVGNIAYGFRLGGNGNPQEGPASGTMTRPRSPEIRLPGAPLGIDQRS